MRKTILILRACAVIAYAFLLIIHFILKDHFWIFQIVFYAFPLPLIILLGSFVTLLFHKPKPYFIFFICTTLVLTGIWLNNAYIFRSEIEIPKNATSIIFWNAANRATIHLDILSENIRNTQPDIIALAETENASAEDLQQLSKAFPAYDFRILEGDMLIGIKGHIEKITYTVEEYSYSINFVEAQLTTGSFLIAFTDTFQSPTMDKRKTLGTILHLVSQRNADIMVGDFNTPYESIHFRNYEMDYTSFHDYGQGFSATWPFGLPLLEIDQIFISKKHTPLLLKKYYHKVSDHAMLIGFFQ